MAGKKEKKLIDVLKFDVKQTLESAWEPIKDDADIPLLKPTDKSNKFFINPPKSNDNSLPANNKREIKKEIAKSKKHRKDLVKNFAPSEVENNVDEVSELRRWIDGYTEEIAGQQFRYEGFNSLLKRLKQRTDSGKRISEDDVARLRSGLRKLRRIPCDTESDLSTPELNSLIGLQRVATQILDSITNELSYDADKLYGDLSKGESAAWRTLCRKYNATIQPKERESDQVDGLPKADCGKRMPRKKYAKAVGVDVDTLKSRIESGDIRKSFESERLVELSISDLATIADIGIAVMSGKIKDQYIEYRNEQKKKNGLSNSKSS